MTFLRFVLGRSGKARRVLVASVFAGMVSGALSVALLALVNAALRAEEGGPSTQLGLLFLALILVVSATRVISVALLATLGQGMVRDLRIELSREVLSSPLARLEAFGPHRLLATLTDDINAITQALAFVPVLFVNGTIVVGCFVYLAWLDLVLFGLLMVAVVVGVAGYRFPTAIAMRKFRAARQEQDALFDHFRGLIEGVKELKLHRMRRGAFVDRLQRTADLVRGLRIRAAVVFGTASAGGQMLFFLVIGVLLFVRPGSVEADREALVGFTVILLYVMTPLQTLLNQFPNVGRAEVAVEKVKALGLQLSAAGNERLAADPEGAAGVPQDEGCSWERLELLGVTHTYEREGGEGDFTVGPVDLVLEPGELVYLVGGNGSGKTTLAKVLVGLYQPDGGTIMVDGREVGVDGLDDYRQLFSVVFGDFYLFDRLLGLETPDVDERARRYLDELEIAHKVEVRDGELSTTDLSQGQRKRLALLTAYLEDRPIYLFDEWAADQDPVFKDVFYREVLPELARRGKAVVAISHDDRYYELADRVVKMADGRVEYDGPAAGMPRFVGLSA